jgi:restriction system protein
MVRAGEGGYLVDEFQERSCVAVGWERVGDLTSVTSLAEVRAAVAKAFPEAKPGNVIITGSTLHKFRSVVRISDHVVTYDPGKREYLLGTVTSDYRYEPGSFEHHPHLRDVSWTGRISRDALSPSSKNTLGSPVTIFEPGDDLLVELQGLLAGLTAGPIVPAVPAEEGLEEFDLIRQDAAGRAHEFLKDRLLRLAPEQMEILVAALLRAMGYKARVTPKGPDRGRDVVASPDGLGFQSPRIFAEVKHRPREPMGSERLRSFLGGLRDGDCGLYVSTGGYTKEARYEADRAKVRITIVDLDSLAELIVEHYERFDDEGRTLVPLVKVYWPAS